MHGEEDVALFWHTGMVFYEENFQTFCRVKGLDLIDHFYHSMNFLHFEKAAFVMIFFTQFVL